MGEVGATAAVSVRGAPQLPGVGSGAGPTDSGNRVIPPFPICQPEAFTLTSASRQVLHDDSHGRPRPSDDDIDWNIVNAHPEILMLRNQLDAQMGHNCALEFELTTALEQVSGDTICIDELTVPPRHFECLHRLSCQRFPITHSSGGIGALRLSGLLS